ncbi:unnamed protein product [Linum tenue]|uniref:Uncharacterized protein n=1 Tax=Linum tenue TaxID=586396 RepID=A0AAV0KU33_9ROSI|nr:unnamed protein product [Linum tenue]
MPTRRRRFAVSVAGLGARRMVNYLFFYYRTKVLRIRDHGSWARNHWPNRRDPQGPGLLASLNLVLVGRCPSKAPSSKLQATMDDRHH